MPVLQRLNQHFFGLHSLVSFIELIQVKSDTLLNPFDVTFCFWGVKLFDLLFTALNLLPSMATTTSVNICIC